MTMWEARAESLPREELERQTLEGLRKTLGHVLANPAWRRRLGGVEPGDIRAIADWSRLPFLTKDELREAYPFGLACAGPERVARIHMSSGTTGNPVVNPYTRADVEEWARATSSRSPRPSASSPAGSGFTTAPSGSGPRSSRAGRAGPRFSSR